MAKQRVMVIGGGLAGLAATMKLAELGIDVDLISLTPVKRSHSVCAQGGINSVNARTRQLGDSEDLHVDDTVYGGDPSRDVLGDYVDFIVGGGPGNGHRTAVQSRQAG